MKYTVEMSNKLNELLTKTYDAEKGFKEAAENVDNTVIKEFFEERAKQRYNFGHELKEEIKAFGQSPDKGGSTKGDLHRAWINLKTFFSTNNEEALLQEVERGEKAAIETYNDILHDKDFVLPPSTESLLMRQRNAIRETLEMSNLYENAVS
ncbi:MAG: PA2169 family four-helix-bundle protein [Croceitalea sp.]|nr:PA2169 family four-helix-bundle protein [Croceitalea sp.]MBT8238771.1 PA2169 family four-helix-bundle protein [Croceitalea sp.]NNC33484.1 PA2169 family four-helix-bundle protein [Croceitalea sp.]NNL08984.1 PA2169 family four-helix-bundle protein [Croceitalea sp.]NNM18558.1 PA2169 family four-helix-bundle protein [Croceitalea sp.]